MANLGYIQITRICNQKCRFCSNPEREATMTLEEIRAHVTDLEQRGYYGTIFTGGEPTLIAHLPDAVRFAAERGMHPRMVSNGQGLADPELVARLKDAGLELVNISLHTYREQLQAWLTENPDSRSNIAKTLENLGDAGITVNINTVINAYNADHLDLTVRWVLKNFPFVSHFVWNNIDPRMNRASQNRDTIPRLSDFEVSLLKAMRYLDRSGRTFRVERVPLCYMAEYAHCSTETRKIVKGEERVVHFLDEKQTVRQTDFEHGKIERCNTCTFDNICAGLYEMGTYYDPVELYPLFLDPQPVIRRIQDEPDGSEQQPVFDAP